MIFAWWLLLIVVAGFAVLLAGFVLPRALIRADYELLHVYDHGVKRYALGEMLEGIRSQDADSAVVCKPRSEYKDYINQYIISTAGKARFLTVKFCEGVRYIDFDVVAFDSRHRVIKILNIKENPENLSECALPPKTAFVSVIVKNVDGTAVQSKVARAFPHRGFLLAALNSLIIFVAVFVIKLCIAKLFAGMFIEAFLGENRSMMRTIAIAVSAAFVNLFCVLGILLVRSRRSV